MVINIAINGGLGNQLFQYALGCYFKQQHQASVFYDSLPLSREEENLTRRPLLLNLLFNDLSYTSQRTHSVFYALQDPLPVKLYKKTIRTISSYKYISETDPFQLQLSDNSTYYFEGYWQWATLADVITEPLNACAGAVLKNNAYAAEIGSAGSSVAMHIRRGDYVTNAFTSSYHGHCDLDYYLRAMEAVEEKINVDRYFIFSDDMDWAKKNISSRHPLVFVEGHEELPVTDLFLMKSCSHQIISNSSFSCWASYLNTNPGKVVVAPVNWTREKKTGGLPLCKSEWILL